MTFYSSPVLRLTSNSLRNASPAKAAKRKTTVEVPARLLKDAASVRVQLIFEGPGLDAAPAETVTIALAKARTDTVDLVLELKAK